MMTKGIEAIKHEILMAMNLIVKCYDILNEKIMFCRSN